MAREKIRLIKVFLIAIFLSNIFLNHLLKPRTFAALSRSDKEIEKMNTEEQVTKPAPVIVRPKVEYKAADLRDPFRRYLKEQERRVGPKTGAMAESLPPLKIQGIIWGGSVAQAIINNKIVNVGDLINSVKIVDINKDGVTVLFGSREYKLSSPGALQLKDLKGDKNEK